MSRFENEDVIFTGQVTHMKLPIVYVNKLQPGDTTPDVANLTSHKAGGSAVAVTNFRNGQQGQRISILGDGVTTIQNGSNIKTNKGADKLLATNTVYRFTFFDNVWYEDS
jgi:hypothetical protein